MAGRCTLIKSVLNTYPLYNMQTNLLPIGIISRLDKACRKFLWNKVDRPKYLAQISWENVTSPMGLGGLGIRRLWEWNLSFMAKLGWKMLTSPNKLWVQILKDRYLKSTTFMECSSKPSQSVIWRDILRGRPLLEKGIITGNGNGKNTSLWYHHWVGVGSALQTAR